MCLVTRRRGTTFEVFDLRWNTLIYIALMFILIMTVCISYTTCNSQGFCYIDTSGIFPLFLILILFGGAILITTSFHWQRTTFDHKTRRAEQSVISAWTKFKPLKRVVDISRIGRFRTTIQDVLGNDGRLMVVAPIIAPDPDRILITRPTVAPFHSDILQTKQFYLTIPPRYACGSDLKRNCTLFPRCWNTNSTTLPSCGHDLDSICHLLNSTNEKITSPSNGRANNDEQTHTHAHTQKRRQMLRPKPAPYAGAALASIGFPVAATMSGSGRETVLYSVTQVTGTPEPARAKADASDTTIAIENIAIDIADDGDEESTSESDVSDKNSPNRTVESKNGDVVLSMKLDPDESTQPNNYSLCPYSAMARDDD